MAKARPKSPRQTAADKAVDAVILLMSRGLSGDVLRSECRSAGLSDHDVDIAIVAARKRVTLAADFNRDEELAKSILQWRELIRLAIDAKSLSDANMARNRLDLLLGLKQPAPIEQNKKPGDTPEAAAIRKHLFPFHFADESQPLAEHVRLAALKLCEVA